MSAVLPSSKLSPKRPRGLRRLIHACVAPSVFDFWAQRLDRTWTWERPLARIVERRANRATPSRWYFGRTATGAVTAPASI